MWVDGVTGSRDRGVFDIVEGRFNPEELLRADWLVVEGVVGSSISDQSETRNPRPGARETREVTG